jgi:CubicO group peptidase (beta-lactamase class C family)
VAEKLTNKSWEELMKEELFVPLNMTSTVLIDDDNIPTIAVPYIADYSGKLHISDERLYR